MSISSLEMATAAMGRCQQKEISDSEWFEGSSFEARWWEVP